MLYFMEITSQVGDLTQIQVDAVVNAANSTLLGGGGVDGALHQAAGPQLLQACHHLRATSHPDGLPVGEAVATPGFNLPARWVIHTVGPNWHRGETDPQLLANCLHASCAVARQLGISSIAFPAISAGAYGWKMPQVAQVLVSAARQEAEASRNHQLRELRFVLVSQQAQQLFASHLHS